MNNTVKRRRQIVRRTVALLLAVVLVSGTLPLSTTAETWDSHESNELAATADANNVILSSPKNLEVISSTSHNITLRWSAPEHIYENEAVTYTVRWARAGGEVVTRSGITSTTFEAGTLHFGSHYDFHVFAVQSGTMSLPARITAHTHAPGEDVWHFDDVKDPAIWQITADLDAQGFSAHTGNRWIAQKTGGTAVVGSAVSGAQRPNSIESWRGNVTNSARFGFISEEDNSFIRMNRTNNSGSAAGGNAVMNIPQFEQGARGELAFDIRVDALNNTQLMVQLIQANPANGNNTRRLGRIEFNANNIVTFAINGQADTTSTAVNPPQSWNAVGSGAVDTTGGWITFRFIYDFEASPATLSASAINPNGTIIELGQGTLPIFAPGYTPNRVEFGYAANNSLFGIKDFDNLILSFSENVDTSTDPANDVAVTKVVIQGTDTILMSPGHIMSLVAEVTPANAWDSMVAWESANSNIATIDINGRLTAHLGGVTTITARSIQNPEIYHTVELEVMDEAPMLTFNASHFEIPLGQSQRIREADKPMRSTDPGFDNYEAPVFTSSDPEIASICENNGFIIAHTVGQVTIRGELPDGQFGVATVVVREQNDYERIRRNYRSTMVPVDLDPTNPNNIVATAALDEEVRDWFATINRSFADGAAGRLWPRETMGSQTLMQDAGLWTRVNRMARAVLTPGSEFYLCPEAFDTMEMAMEWLLDNSMRGQLQAAGRAILDIYYPVGHPERARIDSNGHATMVGNWWHQDIYIPWNAMDVISLLIDAGFDAELLERYGRRLHIFTPSMTQRGTGASSTPTPSHQARYTYFIILEGAIRQDETRFRQGLEGAFTGSQVAFHNSRGPGGGNGFYWDGTVIGHTWFASALGYGVETLMSLANVLATVGGETFMGEPIDFTDRAGFNRLMNELFTPAYLPTVWRGYVMPSLGGRSVGRYWFADGPYDIVEVMFSFLPHLPQDQQALVLEHLRSWALNSPEIMQSNNMFQNAKLQELVADESIRASESTGILATNLQGRTFYRADDFVFGIAINNANVGVRPVTQGNGENWRGQFTGDGMTYLHLDNDPGQFGGNFFATVDSFRMPGTIVEPQNGWGWNGFTNQMSGTGGANQAANSQHTLGGTAVLRPIQAGGGMEAPPIGEVAVTSFRQNMAGAGDVPSNITANRSWFMVDGRVLAMATNITNPGRTNEIVTSIDQRRIAGEIESFVLNGVDVRNVSDIGRAHGPAIGAPNTGTDFDFANRFDSTELSGASWAHLAYGGTGGLAQVGWFIPEGGVGNSGALQTGIETRQATWHEINIRYYKGLFPSDVPLHTDQFANLFINHGSNPNNDSFEYVILPNASRTEVEAFAQRQAGESPVYEVLEATGTLHAVYDYTQNILMIVNFANTPVHVTSPVTGIVYEVSTVANLLIEETKISDGNYQLRMAIHDPTGANANINVNLVGAVGSTVRADENIIVTQNVGAINVAASGLTNFMQRQMNSWEVTLDVVSLNAEIITPGSVQNFAAVQQDYFSAMLTWDAPENASELLDLRYIVSYTLFGVTREVVLPGDTTALDIFPLLDGLEYEFSIRAVNVTETSQTVSATLIIPIYSPQIPLTFESAQVGESITGGVLAGNPNWEFNNGGNISNVNRILDDGGNNVLEIFSPVSSSVSEAIFRFPEITEGRHEFRYRVWTPDIMNSVSLIGVISNGVEEGEARIITVQSDTNVWAYEIQSNFSIGTGGGGANSRPSTVPAPFNQWYDVRIFVDFDNLRTTILIDDQVLVHNSPFRHHAGGLSAVEYISITGFNVLSRAGGPGSIRVDNIYMTASSLVGELAIDKVQAEVGDTLTATFTGRYMGVLEFLWTADGVVIEGESSQMLTVTSAHEGKTIAVSARSTHETGIVQSVNDTVINMPPLAPIIFTGNNPNNLRAYLAQGDVILQTSGNLGIFAHHSPFVIPKGRTLTVVTTLNVQGNAELIIEGTLVVQNGGRVNNQGGAGGTIRIAPSGVLENHGHVENVTNSTLVNYGTIDNRARFEVRAGTTFHDCGLIVEGEGRVQLNIHRNAEIIRCANCEDPVSAHLLLSQIP